MRQRSSRVRGQDAKQVPFDRGEVYDLAVAADRALRKVDSYAVSFHAAFAVGSSCHACTAELGANPRLKLDCAERLRHVVVGAKVEELGLLHVGMPGGQHDDWRRGPSADVAAHIRSGDVRKSEIEYDKVRFLGGGEIDPFTSGSRFQYARAISLEGVTHDPSDLRLVVNDEQCECWHSEMLAGGSAGVRISARIDGWLVRLSNRVLQRRHSRLKLARTVIYTLF